MTKQIEQVGQGYEALKKRYAALELKMQIGASANFSDDEEDQSSDVSDETKRKRAYSIEQAEKKRHVKSREEIEKIALENGDLYAILELEHKTWEAKEKEIRKGYQKLALRFHPDKLGDSITEQGKQMWLKIQLAYDTLTDPARRRRYDSTLPFDDSIPKQGDWNDETFYAVFHEVFERNSMWALKRPCPLIGNQDTPISEVKAFYKYWDNFETWREFAQYDEHKPEEAQDRYERRYMENENKKTRSKYEKKERARLINLAETSYNNDPRIKIELQEAEAQKNLQKQAKKDYKATLAFEKDRARREAEEKALAEAQIKLENEKNAKETIRVTGIIYRAKVKELTELCKIKLSGTKYDKFWVESIQKRFSTIEKLTPIPDFLERCESKEEFIAFITSHMMSEEELKKQKVEENKVQQTAEVIDDGWSAEEVSLVTQAMAKFPVGTTNRWELIRDFVGSKPTPQIMKKVQEIMKKKEIEAENRKAKEAQVKAIILLKETIAAEIEKQINKTQSAAPAQEQVSQDANNSSGSQKSTNNSTPSKNAAQPAAQVEEWTEEQLKQLDSSQRKVPSNLGSKIRWDRIALTVEGKDGKQCFEKFKELSAKPKRK